MLILNHDCLENDRAMLLPLEAQHLEPLCSIGLDPAIWRYTMNHNHDPEDMRRYVERALAERDAGTSIPYVIYDKMDGMLAGCARLMNISEQHRRGEIGSVWYSVSYQGSGLSRHANFLMISYGFEKLDYIRVEFKTDSRNTRAIRFIEKTGAVWEGVLRNHIINADGFIRDTVYFSILQEEWPTKREKYFSDILSQAI